jgi:predicted RNA-binding protein with PUA-like domain
MRHWLLKTEPSEYSYDDLERDGVTLWNGISNALAQKHMRTFQLGDRAFLYHTGKEKAIVGIVEVTGPPEADSEAENDKAVAVRVKAVKRLLRPVTLAEIKADPAFAEWELVKQARLSVMPCPAALWKKVESLSKGA